MRNFKGHRGGWGALALVAVVIGAALPAHAQSAVDDTTPNQTDTGMNGKVTGAGSGSSYGAAGSNMMSQGKGVAGTGMGRTPPAGNAMGTGNSVQGKQGQGITAPITNSTDAAQ